MKWFRKSFITLLTFSLCTASSLLSANNKFAFNLYNQLTQQSQQKNQNLFFSPYSVEQAIAMAYAGARGQTEKEMANVLGADQPQDKYHLENKRISETIKNPYYPHTNVFYTNNPNEINISNKLLVETKILDFFKKTLVTNYNASLEKIDFSNTKLAATRINNWVSKETKDKIKEIVSEGDLKRAKLVITNAIYFKAKWNKQFDSNETMTAPFYLNSNDTVDAKMMFQENDFFYLENDRLQIIELSYKPRSGHLCLHKDETFEATPHISMYIILPKKIDGLSEIEKMINKENFAKLRKEMRSKKVFLRMPKFKLESSYDLKNQLSCLGMPNAFSNAADFSGIDGTKNLYISAVFHKAFVDVTEDGTEAAAATEVVLKPKGIAFNFPPSIFNADHPFMFIIKEKMTDKILFMGRICKP
jgi:serpin B